MSARLQIKTVAMRKDGCFSVLNWRTEEEAAAGADGRPFANSVERTFEPGEAEHGKRVVLGNGLVRCTRRRYHAGGYDTWELHIEGHSAVLFHKGNKEQDSEACVLVAESFGELDGQTAVMDSKGGFGEFMKLTEGLDEFYAEVSGR